jgi:hypothetical protein
MRGSQRGGYRGKKPTKFSPQNARARLDDKDALFSPGSFMKAIALTEDRKEFDRLMLPPMKSQHTLKLQKANHENWRLLRGSLDGKDGSPTVGVLPMRRSITAEDEIPKKTATPPSPLPSPAAAAAVPATLERPSDQNSHRLACSTEVTSGAGFGNSSKPPTPQRRVEYQLARPASSDRKLATPGQLFLKAAKQLRLDSFNPNHVARHTLGLQCPVTTPTTSAENTSTTTTASLEQGTRTDHEPTTSDVETHQSVISSTKAATTTAAAAAATTAATATNNSLRYDITTLKRLQPARGGINLPLAQKAARRIGALQLSQAQSLFFACLAVDVESANYVMKSFLAETQTADHHRDASNYSEISQPLNSCPAPSTATEPAETEITEMVVDEEEGGRMAGLVEVVKIMARDRAGERNCVEEGSDVVFDPFKWLLPVNFQ